MHKHNIPTASHRTFSNHQYALSFIKHEFSLGKQKVVLKNPTIADGQGVFIVETYDGVADILDGEFAQNLDSSSSHSFPDILVEEFIAGPEFTIMALTDGESFTMCPPYLDFKKRKDNDEGPLTGGMGCICPTVRCDWSMFRHLQQTFMARTVKGLKEDGKRPITSNGYMYVLTQTHRSQLCGIYCHWYNCIRKRTSCY